MGYGLTELAYARPFADALVEMQDFREWVLHRTRFATLAAGASLLSNEMLAQRAAGTTYWWRSHYTPACRCFGCNGQETDLLAVFEARTGLRFALHVEVKHPGDKFNSVNQAAAYPARAKCWSAPGKTPKRVLAHDEATTVLLFSEACRERFSPHLMHFDTLLSFEEIERAFPNFGIGIYATNV